MKERLALCLTGIQDIRLLRDVKRHERECAKEIRLSSGSSIIKELAARLPLGYHDPSRWDGF